MVCINKMDLVDWSEDRFNELVEQYKEFASRLDVPHIDFIPISALLGDNVVDRSKNMDWYRVARCFYVGDGLHRQRA